MRGINIIKYVLDSLIFGKSSLFKNILRIVRTGLYLREIILVYSTNISNTKSNNANNKTDAVTLYIWINEQIENNAVAIYRIRTLLV